MENKEKAKSEEIDLIEIVQSLWKRRGYILRVMVVAGLIGLVAAIFGETKYSSSVIVIPQTNQQASGGNLQGLAAMAGINLGAADQSELISPTIYPMVVGSVPFQKELMHSKITVGGHDEPVTLLAYFTEKKYKKFSLFGFLKTYTIGLPGVLLGAIRGKKESAAPSVPFAQGHIETLTDKENQCRNTLSKLLTVQVNEKNNYVTLSTTMPEALMAAQVTARAQELLQEYVTRFKLQKVQTNLDFVEERYREAKTDFEAKQRALAAFQDANLGVVSAVARTREERLSNEYDLAFSIYSEMARQREQASIKVKEDTPIFTVIEPVIVPMERSAPKRAFILAVSLFLGLFVGMGLVIVGPWVTETFKTGDERKKNTE